jgi:hypothetical protein
LKVYWRSWASVLCVCLCGCVEEGAHAREPWPEPSGELGWPLVVSLGVVGEAGEVESFCTGLQIGARHVLTIEHCSAGGELPGAVVSYGARDAAGPLARVIGVRVLPAQGGREGLALVEIEPGEALSARLDAMSWSQLVLSAPSGAAPGWVAPGYGFNCDMRQPSCCDPRVSSCEARPWGVQKQTSAWPLARSGGTVYARPGVGELLCQGDSGAALWRREGGRVEVSGVYSASFLLPGVTLDGTGLEAYTNVCIAWSPGDGSASGRLGVYYSLFMDVCAHEAALRSAVPTLSAACEEQAWCAAAEERELDPEQRAALVEGLREQGACL